jgi:hypothetical protein
MTKRPTQLAKVALRCAKQALPKYSSKFSRHDFDQAQLFAVLVLKAFFKTDYRGIIELLEDFSELRDALGLAEKLPHYSVLCRAEQKLLKKGLSSQFKRPSSIEPVLWVLLTTQEMHCDTIDRELE